MCDGPYTIIHLGNPYDFVIKNVNEPETYGTFHHGDKYDQKSMKKFIEKVNSVVKENEQLKQYIYDNLDEDICDVCSYQYLEKSQMDKYYVAKCKKGYDNCSKGTVIHCKDFKFKELQE